MQHTFLEIVYKIFYDTAQRDFNDVQLLLSEKFSFPSIEFEPKIKIKIPIPKKKNNRIIYSGYSFNDTPDQEIVAWGLFLATLYHLAAHVVVSDYSMYNNWVKNKSPKIFWKVIDFIEDDAVKRYLSSTNPDVWENISKINTNQLKPSKFDRKVCTFAQKLGSRTLDSIKLEMSNEDFQDFNGEHQNRVLDWAGKLYKNHQILKEDTPQYYEQRNHNQALVIKENELEFLPTGKFRTTIKKLDFLYHEEKDMINKFLHKIRKELSGINFDETIFPDEDIYEYFQLREKNKKIIRKMRTQIQNVVNNEEDPQTFYFGDVNLEMAIQAIASNSERYAQVFDKKEEQRIEECWTILIDNSASLRLSFEPVKDFMLCIAEASDALTGPAGSWGLYSFDQKFSVLKDHLGTYNQDAKSRIGGLHSGGLSNTSDAILLAGRLLSKIPSDMKHLFVFTDDFPTGMWNHDVKLRHAIKAVEAEGIEVIGIGLSSNISKYFSDSCWGRDIRELVSKFVTMYRIKSSRSF